MATALQRVATILAKIENAEGCQPGHVAYLTKTAMSVLAREALVELEREIERQKAEAQ